VDPVPDHGQRHIKSELRVLQRALYVSQCSYEAVKALEEIDKGIPGLI
jgi:hypothetical protein